MLPLTLAAVHLLALGLGLGAVLNRGTALREVPDERSLRRVFRADVLWGLAALLWIATGLWRYLGSIEKSTAYYNANGLFVAKMALFALVLVFEVWPMAVLLRWRVVSRRGASAAVVVVPGTARLIAAVSYLQALLVAAMVFAAVAMARGYSA